MKCKYCKTDIDLFEWLFYFKKCGWCLIEEKKLTSEIQRKDSNKYWKKNE